MGGTPGGNDALDLAERALGVLSEGSFSATYKYAVFVGLIDLCLEKTSKHGVPPATLTTRELAAKVVELYWPHALPFDEERGVLRQGGVRKDHQAEILARIARYRTRTGSEALARARLRADWNGLLDFVEWKLIEMPLPRLQRLGAEHEDRFLYDYFFDDHVRQREVSAYQRGAPSDFDNRIMLHPRVAENLVRLNGVLRPLLHREWAAKVAQLNNLPEFGLERFLFGAGRETLEPVREPLREIQGDCCFYCGGALDQHAQVDHFIPWARYPDNGLDNLVLAHAPCNRQKLDFLAAAAHVENWVERGVEHEHTLADMAHHLAWERSSERTRGVAVAIYRALPPDARLWLRKQDFVRLEASERARLDQALAA